MTIQYFVFNKWVGGAGPFMESSSFKSFPYVEHYLLSILVDGDLDWPLFVLVWDEPAELVPALRVLL